MPFHPAADGRFKLVALGHGPGAGSARRPDLGDGLLAGATEALQLGDDRRASLQRDALRDCRAAAPAAALRHNLRSGVKRIFDEFRQAGRLGPGFRRGLAALLSPPFAQAGQLLPRQPQIEAEVAEAVLHAL